MKKFNLGSYMLWCNNIDVIKSEKGTIRHTSKRNNSLYLV